MVKPSLFGIVAQEISCSLFGNDYPLSKENRPAREFDFSTSRLLIVSQSAKIEFRIWRTELISSIIFKKLWLLINGGR